MTETSTTMTPSATEASGAGKRPRRRNRNRNRNKPAPTEGQGNATSSTVESTNQHTSNVVNNDGDGQQRRNRNRRRQNKGTDGNRGTSDAQNANSGSNQNPGTGASSKADEKKKREARPPQLAKVADDLVDIGVNLPHRQFARDVDQVLKRAVEAGVTQIVCTGVNVKQSERALEFAKKERMCVSTVGIHPHDAKTCNDEAIQRIKAMAKEDKIVAIGETGLDFNRNLSPQDVQRRSFEEHVKIAVECGKPLFLHEREAHEAFVEILAKYQGKLPKVVVHCFTGTEDEARAYLKMGFFLGVTGWVCDERRGAPLQQAVKAIPLDRLMIETDAPFLTPRTKELRGQRRNEPAYLGAVVQKIAEIKGEDVSAVAAATTKNAKEFFGI